MKDEENENARQDNRFVLDSFALLAYLEDEPGASEVEQILEAARHSEAQVWMPVINLGEVLYITEREQSLEAAQTALAAIDQLAIEVVEADRSLTLEAAHVKAHRPLSYADAFVVALALQKGAEVVTGDPEFRQAEEQIAILRHTSSRERAAERHRVRRLTQNA